MHRVNRRIKVRTDAVHLIDKGNPWDDVLVRLAPDRLRLRLHTGNRVEYRDRAVEDAQGTLHFRREIHVAGRVDDVHPHLDAFKSFVDAFLFLLHPGAGRRGGSNRDAALAFLLHPVRHGRAFVHFTDLVDHAGIKKNALRQRRLARVNVRGDADVPRPLERELAIGRIWILRRHGFF